MATFGIRLARDVLLVSGADADMFLEGQLSQSLAGIPVDGSAWSFLLQPEGKVQAWFRVNRRPDGFVLDIDAGFGPPTATALTRFLIRMKCTVETATWEMIAVRGPDAAPLAGDPGASAFSADPEWPGVEGVDLLGPTVGWPEGLVDGDRSAYEFERISAGVPAMGTELTTDVIPAEAGVVERSVSFVKGCFTGQELVARIDSRGGNVPRRLRRLTFVADAAPSAGSLVRFQGDTVGSITSSIHDGHRGVALAYLKRKVEVPAAVTVVDGDHELTAEASG